MLARELTLLLSYLFCLVGPSLEEGVSRWAGEEEDPNVPLKAREVQMK